MDPRGILFDFDGTLAPNLDLPDMRRQVIELTRSFDVPEPVWEGQLIVEIINVSAAHLQVVDPATADHYEQQAHQLITDIELRAAAETDPFPGVRELLNNLRDAGIRTGVVTRNCRAAVLATFPDLLQHVDILTARGDCEYLKPDPRHALFALDYLGVPPRQASMVGDGHLDMRLGRALDMHCVGVLSGSNNRQGMLEHGAHRVMAVLHKDTDIQQLLAI